MAHNPAGDDRTARADRPCTRRSSGGGDRRTARGLRFRVLVCLPIVLLLATQAWVSAASAATPAARPAYVVGTYDGARLRLFVDGKLVAQLPVTEPPNQSPTPVEIGSFLGGDSWYGTLDEVAIYDRALDSTTLRQHYRLGSGAATGSYPRGVQRTPGLVAYWRLNDPTAARAVDVLGKHPGVYRAGSALRVPGLISGDRDLAAAFSGAGGDVVVQKADDLSLRQGFTLEAWAAPGAIRDQVVIAKVNSWFVKMDPSGHWGVGITTAHGGPSVYGDQRAEIVAAPVALAQPPPAAPLPRRYRCQREEGFGFERRHHRLGFNHRGCRSRWLLYRRQRQGAPHDEDDDGDEPEVDPDDPDAPTVEAAASERHGSDGAVDHPTATSSDPSE